MPTYLEPAALHDLVEVAVSPMGQLRQLIALPGGASVRHYHRGFISAGSIDRFLVMELGESPQFSDEVSAGKVSELPFLNVQRYLASRGLPVPLIYQYDEKSGLLYLEDFGDITFESKVAGADIETQRDYYERAITQLVKIQAVSRETPDPACIAFSRSFDFKLLKWELDHFVEFELDAVGIMLPTAERAELDRQFTRIAEELHAQPTTFVHRDYQSRNLMILNDGRLGILDFQDALLGNSAYDLVGLLRDSYVVLPPALVDDLVDFFVASSGPHLDSDFRRLFFLQVVQRKLKDAGRFVFIDKKKNNRGFLRHIPSSLDYVAAALQKLPELDSVGAILERHTAPLRQLARLT